MTTKQRQWIDEMRKTYRATSIMNVLFKMLKQEKIDILIYNECLNYLYKPKDMFKEE